MANIYNLKPGATIRVVKTFRDCYGHEFAEGRILHFTGRNYLPYHAGHTVYFREAAMYLCDDDETCAIVQNHSDEYYELKEQPGDEQPAPNYQFQAAGDERALRPVGRASKTRTGQRYKTVFTGMLAVAIAFGVAIPLGFGLRARYPAIPDQVFGASVAIILFGIAAGVMRLLGPLWLPKKHNAFLAMRLGSDVGPDKEWSSDAARWRTGYEISFHDFHRLVSDPSCQPVIAPLLKDWYGYAIVGQGPETTVRSEEGHAVGLRPLHNRIQIDRSKQRTIYDRAMDLWR